MKPRNPEGIVTEALEAGRFRVQMDEGALVICYIAGKMKLRKVNIMIGDRVEVVLDPAGGTASNRIVWRR